MKRLLLAILAVYRAWISPALHALSPFSGCRYHPTCSHYATEAILIHGAAAGSWLALRRLLRCHPFHAGGFDPVPLPDRPHDLDHQTAAAPTAGAQLSTFSTAHHPLP